MGRERDIEEATRVFLMALAFEAAKDPKLRGENWQEKAALLASWVGVGMAASASSASDRFFLKSSRHAALILDGLSFVAATKQPDSGLKDEWVQAMRRVAERKQALVSGYTPARGPIQWDRLRGTSSPN